MNNEKHGPTLAQLARQRGLQPSTVTSRVKLLGWSIEEALTRPVSRNGERSKARMAGRQTYQTSPCRVCGSKYRQSYNRSCIHQGLHTAIRSMTDEDADLAFALLEDGLDASTVAEKFEVPVKALELRLRDYGEIQGGAADTASRRHPQGQGGGERHD